MADAGTRPKSTKPLTLNHVFEFLTMTSGEKVCIDKEPLTGKRTLVTSTGLTDDIFNADVQEEDRIDSTRVCHTMLPFLRQVSQNVVRKGILMSDEDKSKFELDDVDPDANVEGKVMSALSLGGLMYGMITLTDDEVLFMLHPTRMEWIRKGQELYGLQCESMLKKALQLKCAVPSCKYVHTYYPHLFNSKDNIMLTGPAVLPKFIREGLMDHSHVFLSHLNLFNAYVETPHAYPLLCLPCLMSKQMTNMFSARLTFDSNHPQLTPFTIVELLRDSNIKEGEGCTFIQRYIKKCRDLDGVTFNSDLYEVGAENKYLLQRMPFRDFEISFDQSENLYSVRCKTKDVQL